MWSILKQEEMVSLARIDEPEILTGEEQLSPPGTELLRQKTEKDILTAVRTGRQ